MTFHISLGGNSSSSIPFSAHQTYEQELATTSITSDTLEKTSSLAEETLKKRSFSPSDTDSIESAPKRTKGSIASLLWDVSSDEPATFPKGFEMQRPSEKSFSESSSTKTENLSNLDRELIEYRKLGVPYYSLGIYFKGKYGIKRQKLKERWKDFHKEHFRDVEETQAKPYDAFLIERLRGKTGYTNEDFKKIASEFNEIKPLEQPKVNYDQLRKRMEFLGKGYPDQTYFPNLLPKNSLREHEIALMLKCGFSFKMLERKLGYFARDIQHHWNYHFASKYPDVEPLSTKLYEESIIEGLLLGKADDEMYPHFPFFSHNHFSKTRRDLEYKYGEIISNIQNLFPEKIHELRSGSLSLDELFEEYFRYEQEHDPEIIAINVLEEMKASHDRS